MRHRARKINYLEDSPLSILMAVCGPLIVVNLVQVFTTFLTNGIQSRYVGQEYFTVLGYLTTVLNTFASFLGGFVSAAWIRTARFFAIGNQKVAMRQTVQATYAIILVYVVMVGLLLLLMNPILHAVHVPAEIYENAKLYYRVYLLTYLPVPLGTFFLSVITGTGSAGRILLVNLLTVILSSVNTVFLLVICRLEMIGGAMLVACNGFVQLMIAVTLLRQDKLFYTLGWKDLIPDFRKIFDVISYGVLLAVQTMLCNVGYLAATIQTNAYLSPEYISVLQISLPLGGVMGAISQSCSAFYPQNYGAGKTKRVKQYVTLSTLVCLTYGTLCFLIFKGLAHWYYGQLFTDPAIVELGAGYWFWNGIGCITIACVYTVRVFFDAVGMGSISLLSGVGELIGNMVCALWIIPTYGNVGRSMANPVGWGVASAFLLIAYLIFRKKIYAKSDAWAVAHADS